MKIDNVTRDYRSGDITSRVHGFTFTHGKDCKLHRENPMALDFATCCDCFLSRIDITEVNGVPVGTYRRPWWKPQWSLFSFMAGVVVSSLWDWFVPYA